MFTEFSTSAFVPYISKGIDNQQSLEIGWKMAVWKRDIIKTNRKETLGGNKLQGKKETF